MQLNMWFFFSIQVHRPPEFYAWTSWVRSCGNWSCELQFKNPGSWEKEFSDFLKKVEYSYIEVRQAGKIVIYAQKWHKASGKRYEVKVYNRGEEEEEEVKLSNIRALQQVRSSSFGGWTQRFSEVDAESILKGYLKGYIKPLAIGRTSVAVHSRKRRIVMVLYWGVQRDLCLDLSCDGKVGGVLIFLLYTLIYGRGQQTHLPLPT